MIVNTSHSAAARCCGLLSAMSTILIILCSPELVDARKPQFGSTNITRGQTVAGADYMHGGFTYDDRVKMEAQSAPYNLKIIFAPPAGILTSSILLMIGDNRSRRVDKIIIQAPWFYIQLPPGGYTIMARIKNKIVLIRDVYLRESRRATYFVRGD
jgi:hypothetical protein